MRIRAMDWQAALLIASVVGFCATIRTGPVRVADLGPGERIEIRYRSRGWLGTDRGRITLTPEAGGAVRYRAEMLGAVRAGVLEARDAARLDRELEIFREDRANDCADQRWISVTRSRGWLRLRHERQLDSACGDERAFDFYDLFPLP